MATKTITSLSSAAAVGGTEVLPIDQSGSTVKVQIADLTPGLDTFIGDGGSPASAKGLVPAAASGDAAAGRFLKADGTWASPTAVSTLTTKGDLLTYYSSALQRLAVGSDGQVVAADSAQTAGIKWATPMGQRIARVVTTGSATTITFSSIPGTYTDLMIVMSGRDTGSTGEVAAQMKINGDTNSGNYTAAQYNVGAGTGTSSKGTVAATSSGVTIGIIPGVNGNANAIGMTIVTIPNYAGTSFQKIVSQDISYIFGSTITKAQQMWIWKSAAAITSLTITANGAFADGTTATLYGMG